MPELPEVESIAAGLRRRLVGLAVAGVDLRDPKLLRRGRRSDLKALSGRRIEAVRRRGKLLIIECGGPALVFHLKMTGGFSWAGPGVPVDKHTRFVISFRGTPGRLRFRDMRRFGFLLYLPDGRWPSCPEARDLGPEPLEIGLEDFVRRLHARRGRLKSLLLDQAFLAGIGNIYADEMLFESGIHPRTASVRLTRPRAGRLWTAMRGVLSRAIAAGGSSVRDYRNADGEIGHFQDDHRVYGREGMACPRCGARIRRQVIGGRSAHFCPRCQRA